MSDEKPSAKGKGKGRGWRQLRIESEKGFESNFAPLRTAIKRNEFIGSIFELFVSALMGIGKIGLSVPEDSDDSKEDLKTL